MKNAAQIQWFRNIIFCCRVLMLSLNCLANKLKLSYKQTQKLSRVGVSLPSLLTFCSALWFIALNFCCFLMFSCSWSRLFVYKSSVRSCSVLFTSSISVSVTACCTWRNIVLLLEDEWMNVTFKFPITVFCCKQAIVPGTQRLHLLIINATVRWWSFILF